MPNICVNLWSCCVRGNRASSSDLVEARLIHHSTREQSHNQFGTWVLWLLGSKRFLSNFHEWELNAIFLSNYPIWHVHFTNVTNDNLLILSTMRMIILTKKNERHTKFDKWQHIVDAWSRYVKKFTLNLKKLSELVFNRDIYPSLQPFQKCRPYENGSIYSLMAGTERIHASHRYLNMN